MKPMTSIDDIAEEIPPLKGICDKAFHKFQSLYLPDECPKFDAGSIRCIDTQDYFVAALELSEVRTHLVGTSFERGVGDVNEYKTVPINTRLCVYWVAKPRYGKSEKVHEWYSPKIYSWRLEKARDVALRRISADHHKTTWDVSENPIKVGWENCKAEALTFRLDLDNHKDPQYIL